MKINIENDMDIPIGNVMLKGDLAIPEGATAMIIFAHGSGSSRLSSRNRMVAEYLNKLQLGTCLFDLLTYEEDSNYQNRFNIKLLSNRLVEVTLWLKEKKEAKDLVFGYFGASTGAAAALYASVAVPEIAAVVSRGGRPDLAMEAIPEVKSPTLLIVGSRDTDVLKLNRQVFDKLDTEKKLEIIPGASHLFEEKGTMEQVCVVAGRWFEKYLHHMALESH